MDWEALCRQLQAQISVLELENAALRARLGLPEQIKPEPTELTSREKPPQSIYIKSSSVDKIKLFRTLFRGREDAFARRWYSEKTG